MLTELVAFLQKLEGVKLSVYKDTAGIDTIGIGTLWKEGMPTKITEEEAVAYCERDCTALVTKVDKLVTTMINDNQRLALCSFAYNEGVSALAKSTLLKLLNLGDVQHAADEFLKWDKEHLDGELVEVPGLLNRRKVEREKFLESV